MAGAGAIVAAAVVANWVESVIGATVQGRFPWLTNDVVNVIQARAGAGAHAHSGSLWRIRSCHCVQTVSLMRGERRLLLLLGADLAGCGTLSHVLHRHDLTVLTRTVGTAGIELTGRNLLLRFRRCLSSSGLRWGGSSHSKPFRGTVRTTLVGIFSTARASFR